MKNLTLTLAALLVAQTAYAGPAPKASVLSTQGLFPAGIYKTSTGDQCTLVLNYSKNAKGTIQLKASLSKKTKFGNDQLAIEITSANKNTMLEKESWEGTVNYKLWTSEEVISNEEETVDHYQAIEFQKKAGNLVSVVIDDALVNDHSDPHEETVYCDGQFTKIK
jgi:hypothetical protein